MGGARHPKGLRRRADPRPPAHPVGDWRKLLGETVAVIALLDRLLHLAHVLKYGPEAGAPGSRLPCANGMP